MEFFYHIKATQKSGKPDGVIWFSANTASRAALQLDVALEDVGIETGRGKDYAKPVRTDFPVFNDLPEESTIDYTWCERYTLADDQRTWNVIPGTAPQVETALAPASTTTSDADLPAAPATSIDTTNAGSTSLLENRTPAIRFAVHLLGDKYHSEISQEQQIVANELAFDEGNVYFQNLLQAKNDVPELDDLSLHAEWKLVQAVKDVFPQDKEHEPALLAAFMSGWIKADAGDRNQLVDYWKSGKLPAKDEPDYWYENGLRVLKNDDGSTRYAVCKLPFRQQLLAQLTVDELRHHVTRGEHAELHALESDIDNSYVKTLLLAAESCPELKDFDTKALWSYTDAIRKVFIQEKRHELALVLRFTRMWVATEDCDHETLTSEWAAGHRTEAVGISKDQQSEEPQPSEPYKRAVPQNMANLSIEIAIALLYPDAVPGKINRAQLMAAKELADKKDEAHARALKVLGKTSDITDYNADSIFGISRAILWGGDITTVELRKQVREWFTANGIYENGERSKGYPEWDEDPRADRQAIVEEPAATSQPQVANLGGGVFSIEDLMNENKPQTDDRSPITEETTSDVQMETTDPAEGESVDAVPPGQGANAAAAQTNAVAGTICTGCGTEGGGGCPDCGAAVGDATYVGMEAGLEDELETLGADTSNSETMFTHMMVDLETMGKKPGAPIVSVGAVFFDPASGKTGAEYYQVISLESSMSFGARPDASTILWWLKQSPEARSAIVVDDTVGLVEALEQFLDFIAENAANGSKNVQLWGNGSSFDCSLLEAAFELADTPFPIPHWNYRDVRTVVELGKAVGLNSRYDIPFEGDQHNALADARHQVKYVSAIWQRLTAI